ncbi:tRNA (adenosine(37)-N6)-threonylcarbamoyltransferase complex dimerization subunit type 1 TsaB [Novosphingobium cyanobacteriorum]|uniref:N(6)-L-threonylcarbamoyladenine synthase n=1 Tax=Novosphingobium cyanobacteriorum TaxID=3024215 RepID=A0ABT6CGF6_9SPHN|nr:tRNA (adenosine(37)-N6)-threonylcarbamoyltransferase complex dimerization subunit type 1 TsaB [Novosphingobium cyanobacteriorum]MDF8332599.1 tRNA (adenosine(37)-N6)-threonylcarbamoyltransferase complex dimerization subunit type 1 TsaB [Novosphingobium cyanobacteriorum]
MIDSATEACSVALFEDGALLAGECLMLGRGHAERLVPMIEALPDKGRADRIVVDSGPGSFTGIRVGLAAARALSLAWGVPVSGFSSLALVAAMALEQHPGQPVDVVMTGGHGEWFLQPFDATGAPLAPLASLPPDAAMAASTAPVIAGSQADALAAARTGAVAVPLWPDARTFALLRDGAIAPDPVPAYGRAPDARLPSVPVA